MCVTRVMHCIKLTLSLVWSGVTADGLCAVN